MLPVTLTLGLINVSTLIGTLFASRLINPDLAPRAIDLAFRLYMLPQGIFSVAVATVLFPTMSRLAARGDMAGFGRTVDTGVRQIGFLLIPAGLVSAVLAEPITRLVYERGEFTAAQTPVVAGALAAFSVGLVFNGWMLLLNRAFYGLQANWIPTLVALGNLVLNVILFVALYPVGVWGLPLAVSLVQPCRRGRARDPPLAARGRRRGRDDPDRARADHRRVGGRVGRRRRASGGRSTLSLGRSIVGQIVSVGLGARRSGQSPTSAPAACSASASSARCSRLAAAPDRPDRSDRAHGRAAPTGSAPSAASPRRSHAGRTRPMQGAEGAPDAWIVFEDDVRDAMRDLRPGDDVLVLTWLHEADRASHARPATRRPASARDAVSSAPAHPTGRTRSASIVVRGRSRSTAARVLRAAARGDRRDAGRRRQAAAADGERLTAAGRYCS